MAAQGGISAALGNMEEDDWRWHMYDTVKGSDWLGDQDAIEYLVQARDPGRSLSSSITACRSRARDDGKIYQRAFGGMTLNYGEKGRRSAPAPPPTAPAMPCLHTLYQQSLRHKAAFFIEYFALDLIMDEEGACQRRASPGTSTTARCTASAHTW